MNGTAHTTPYKFSSLEFASAYLTTMRPYLMFVSGITGLVGLSFTHDVPIAQVALVFVASFFSYGFGQALTDCFQIDTDSLSSPYRPLTQGLISRKQVFCVSAIGLILCTTIFSIYNPINLALGLVAGLGLATYTPFKRRWWSGPFYNSWIVVALCLMAFMTGRQEFSLSLPAVCALFAVFFGYANFVLSGYFKDISADGKTGYNTLPVVFGRKTAAVVSDVFAGLTVAAAAAFAVWNIGTGRMTVPALIAVVLSFVGTLTALAAQVRLHRVSSDEEAHSAIAPVVHSYILVLSSIVCFQKPEWTAFLIVFYAAFVLVLKIRPAKNQI